MCYDFIVCLLVNKMQPFMNCDSCVAVLEKLWMLVHILPLQMDKVLGVCPVVSYAPIIYTCMNFFFLFLVPNDMRVCDYVRKCCFCEKFICVDSSMIELHSVKKHLHGGDNYFEMDFFWSVMCVCVCVCVCVWNQYDIWKCIPIWFMFIHQNTSPAILIYWWFCWNIILYDAFRITAHCFHFGALTLWYSRLTLHHSSFLLQNCKMHLKGSQWLIKNGTGCICAVAEMLIVKYSL